MTERRGTMTPVWLALVAVIPLWVGACKPSSGTPAGSSTSSVAAPLPKSKNPACADAVYPEVAAIENGTYVPLSRPLFIYVNKRALAKPEVAAYLRYYLGAGQEIVKELDFIQVPEAKLKEEQAKLEAAIGEGQPKPGLSELQGSFAIDGSSTVYPISAGIAEKFQELTNQKVKPAVKKSGTGGGFKKFTVGEIDINGASRPISPEEIDKCAANKIEYVAFNVAIDGITVVANRANDWCDCLTVEQLKSIWEPGSKVKTWRDVNPDWAAEQIKLYGADTDSGTFDYFTEAICGKAKSSRTDYIASAEDNVLVRGVIGDRTALGYIPFSYFVANKDALKALGIVPPKKAE